MALKQLLKGQISYMRNKEVDILMISSDGKDLKKAMIKQNPFFNKHSIHHIEHLLNRLEDNTFKLWTLYRF